MQTEAATWTIEILQRATISSNGAAICWEIKKQSTVALSSTKAEYQAMAAAVQEAIYLRAFMNDFGYPMKEPNYIGENYLSCIKMCHNRNTSTQSYISSEKESKTEK